MVDFKPAMELADKLCKLYAERRVIAEEDQAVIDRYVELGLIELKKPKKEYGKEIFFPTLQAPEFEGIAMIAWMLIIQDALRKHNIQNNFGINSAREYMSKPHLYMGMIEKEDLAVRAHSLLAPKEVKEQEKAIRELLGLK